jgi:hypothetical protein
MKLYLAKLSPPTMLSNRKLYCDFSAILRYAMTGVRRSAGREVKIGMQLPFFDERRDVTSSREGWVVGWGERRGVG